MIYDAVWYMITRIVLLPSNSEYNISLTHPSLIMFWRGFLALLAGLAAILAILLSGNTVQVLREEPPGRQRQGRNNTVLFLSNAEHGLANVVLATSHAMLVEQSDIEVHYASFQELAGDVATINRFVRSNQRYVHPITYHTLEGPTYGTALNSVGHGVDETIGGPGIAGIGKLCGDIQKYLMPWSGPEYLALYQQIFKVLEEVDPAIVVVEPQFGPGLDAIRTLGRKHAVLTPNALKDNFADLQPRGAILWKYPRLVGSSSLPNQRRL